MKNHFSRLIIGLTLVTLNLSCSKADIDPLNGEDEISTFDSSKGYILYGFGYNQNNEFGSVSFGTYNKSFYITDKVSNVFTHGQTTAIIKSDSSLYISENGRFKFIKSKILTAAVGLDNAYFVDDKSNLYGFGSNKYGQLGRENYGGSIKNYRLVDTDVVSVSAGGDYVMYVKRDNALWGLGNNFHNQISPEFVGDFIYPQKIRDNIKKVVCGDNFTLFLDSETRLFGMGANHSNRFGIVESSVNSSVIEPLLIMDGIKDFAIGERFLLFLNSKGVLFGSGYNNTGQLNEKPSDYYEDRPLKAKKITENVQQIAAGAYHSLVLKKDGSLWSCGANANGQLGDGTYYLSYELLKIDSKVKSIFASAEHSLILK